MFGSLVTRYRTIQGEPENKECLVVYTRYRIVQGEPENRQCLVV